MSSDLAIQAVAPNRAGIRRFLTVPYGIYDGDPNWVAPLMFDQAKVFTRANPLFEHAEMHLWVARQGDRDVGRIAAILDRYFNRTEPVPTAFWGFFECVNDRTVSSALFEAVAAWARHRGMQRLLGPMNPTSNDECGLLAEGFDSPPTLMMPYNPRYYVDLVETDGFRKTKDLLAFYVDIAQAPLERLERLAEKVRKRYPELVFTPVRKKTLTADLDKIKDVYNSAWQANWGFTPMTDAEIDFLADRLKPLLVEGLVWVVEFRREPVGFMLAVPDYNQAFKPLRGRLLTPKLFGALPYLVQRKFPTCCRVITLGTKEAWRNRGLESVMLSEGFKTGARVGFKDAEASWILEDNEPMVRLMGIFGGHVYKRYRLYDRQV